MGIGKRTAILGLVAVMACSFVGCGGEDKDRSDMRPDMDKVVSGEHGLQSRDLREMTDKMAPDMLTAPEIAQNPYRAVIVVKGVQNKTEDMPGRNLDIYAARLAGLLNQAATRDRLSFVEEKAVTEQLQNEELGGVPGVKAAGDTRTKPQYALYGTFYSQDNGKTTYYLCQFKLTSLLTGQEVWQNQYEVRTLN
jgi:PBP1b-binding outer membrane lipoprotein LpoB